MKRALLGLMLLALAAPALATEGEGAVSPFAGDVGTALWTLVIFVLVVVVLGRFAWGPILKTLQAREDFIRQSLEQAKHDREAAEEQLKAYTEKLTAARAEATAIVDEGRRDAEVVKRRIEAEAREEAERVIERAKREIGIAKETAVKELYSLSARLATGIAGRILDCELTGHDHERLIREAIEEYGHEAARAAHP